MEDSFTQVDGFTATSLDEKCEIKEEISEVIKTEGDQKSYSECVKTEVIAKINTEIKPKPAFKEIESDCSEILKNENIGGLAIALTHGSILYEVNLITLVSSQNNSANYFFMMSFSFAWFKCWYLFLWMSISTI